MTQQTTKRKSRKHKSININGNCKLDNKGNLQQKYFNMNIKSKGLLNNDDVDIYGNVTIGCKKLKQHNGTIYIE